MVVSLPNVASAAWSSELSISVVVACRVAEDVPLPLINNAVASKYQYRPHILPSRKLSKVEFGHRLTTGKSHVMSLTGF